jgi:hypothetical protein
MLPNCNAYFKTLLSDRPCRMWESEKAINLIRTNVKYTHHLLKLSITLTFYTECIYRFLMVLGVNSGLFP